MYDTFFMRKLTLLGFFELEKNPHPNIFTVEDFSSNLTVSFLLGNIYETVFIKIKTLKKC